MDRFSEIAAWMNALDEDPEVRLIFVFLLGSLGFMLTLALSFFARALFDPGQEAHRYTAAR